MLHPECYKHAVKHICTDLGVGWAGMEAHARSTASDPIPALAENGRFALGDAGGERVMEGCSGLGVGISVQEAAGSE